MAGDPVADESEAFGVDGGSAYLRHHDFGSDARETIDEDGLIRVAGDDVELQVVHVAGGVGMFAVARLKVAVTKIDSCVTRGAAGLMTMGAVVIEVR